MNQAKQQILDLVKSRGRRGYPLFLLQAAITRTDYFEGCSLHDIADAYESLWAEDLIRTQDNHGVVYIVATERSDIKTPTPKFHPIMEI